MSLQTNNNPCLPDDVTTLLPLVREQQVATPRQSCVDLIGSMNSYAYLEEDPATTIFDFDVGDYFEHQASVRYTRGE